MKKTIKQIGIIGAIVVVSSTIYLVWNGSIGFSDSLQSTETRKVWYAGQRFVAERLGFPKNAFWGWRTDEQPVTELENGHFVTAGWVRFERSSGEIDVLKFKCEIRRRFGEWELIDLAMPNFVAL